jgi:soluble cytochrome b562
VTDLQVNLFRRNTMGMRIQATGTVGSSQSVGAAAWQQRQQSFKDLTTALQSGDLGGAKKAFSTLTGGTGTVGQALQNGDLAGAQTAMQQVQASRAGHHHHHANATQTAATGVTAPGSVAGAVGALLSVTAPPAVAGVVGALLSVTA